MTLIKAITNHDEISTVYQHMSHNVWSLTANAFRLIFSRQKGMREISMTYPDLQQNDFLLMVLSKTPKRGSRLITTEHWQMKNRCFTQSWYNRLGFPQHSDNLIPGLFYLFLMPFFSKIILDKCCN